MSERTSTPHRFTIDIYSDVVCPWCVIGYGQLTKAMAELDGEIAADIRWRAFELNPDMPDTGEEQEAHLQRKYGRSEEQGKAARARIQQIAEEAGVSLAYVGPEPAPPAMMWNTRECHLLLHFALEQAGPRVQTALKLALFEAHFNHRRDLSDRSVLLDLAASAGLHREAAKIALDDAELNRRVVAEQQAAWDHNISGVPAMIVNSALMIPGAQSAETYVNLLRRVAHKLEADS